MQYELLVESTSSDLESAVNRLLGNGWELYGNPFATSKDHYGNDSFCQAMIKRAV